MIIVEGPDGSGKTTTIERLGFERLHLKALRQGAGSEGANPKGWGGSDVALLAYSKKILEVLELEEQPRPENCGLCMDCVGDGRDTFTHPRRRIALDRFHLSEAAYAPILRPSRVEVREGELEMLTQVTRLKKVPVILCLPPFAVTLKNVMQEGRERPSYQTEAFLHRAWKAFEKLAPYATIVYDFTKDELPTLV